MPSRRLSRPNWVVYWASEGRIASVNYFDAPAPIALEEIPAEWRTPTVGPFTRHGGVKQGYLFPLASSFLVSFRTEFGAGWPDLIALTEAVSAGDRFGEFVRWGRRFFEWDRFEEDERTYKLEIAAHLATVRAALLGGGDWVTPITTRHRQDNLLPWQVASRLTEWFRADGTAAAQALQGLWQAAPLASRFEAFLGALPADVVSGRGMRTAVTAYFLGAEDVTEYPMYRPTPFERAHELAGREQPEAETEYDIYSEALSFLDEIRAAFAADQTAIDRLDAQGILWALTKTPLGTPPVSDWSHEDQLAFRRFRGEEDEDHPPSDPP